MTWVIPSTISASAQDLQELTLGSEEFSQLAARSLMWRSKPSPSQTWLKRWKRESWIQHLSGRTFGHLTGNPIVERWMSSQVDSHVNHSVQQGTVLQMMTQDTCSQQSNESSEKFDQDLFSSKTLKASSHQSSEDKKAHQFSCMSWENWKALVSQQRGACSQRKKLVPRTEETESSLQQWPTATVGDSRDTARGTTKTGVMHKGSTLTDATRTWPTPTVQEAGKISNRPNFGQTGLSNHPSIQGKTTRQKLNKSRDGLPDQDRSNTIGKSQGQLNPDWVEQLMGIPVGWTCPSSEWTD